MIPIDHIDVHLDFTGDTPHYWDGFWDNDSILGKVNGDPDVASKALRSYQKILWSKKLPNGDSFDLSFGSGRDNLTWNGMRFGSDSITASFRYRDYRHMMMQVADSMPDWHSFVEDFIRRSYTIGGEIIFPKRMNGINQSRGLNRMIRDRWDLTLECIRRYYDGCSSPLYDVLKEDSAFFDLFVDFRGYVDFFFLQDCASSDYRSVVIWLDNDGFNKGPLPTSVDEYLLFIDKELRFVEMRNMRIEKAIGSRFSI